MLGAAAVATFAIGAALLGLGPREHAGSKAAGDGCALRPLRFGVTDDARAAELQRRFELRVTTDGAVLPRPRMYDRPLDPVASLHAASHAHVVVYFRGGLSRRELAPLRELSAQAVALRVPLLVSPRAQRTALVAIRDGAVLTCAASGTRQLDAVRAFTAALYPSLER